MSLSSSRAKRLLDLYALRAKIEAEIVEIETSVQHDVNRAVRLRAEFEQRPAITHQGERKPAQCGTDSGYQRHVRYFKEPACLACRTAHAVAEASRRKRRPAS